MDNLFSLVQLIEFSCFFGFCWSGICLEFFCSAKNVYGLVICMKFQGFSFILAHCSNQHVLSFYAVDHHVINDCFDLSAVMLIFLMIFGMFPFKGSRVLTSMLLFLHTPSRIGPGSFKA